MDKKGFNGFADDILTCLQEAWNSTSDYDKAAWVQEIKMGFESIGYLIKYHKEDAGDMVITTLGVATCAVILRKLYEGDLVLQPGDFQNVIDDMKSLYARKNADYGNSFDRSLDEDGLLVAKIRIGDKVGRLLRLTQPGAEQQVKDESICDTLIDLANYCVMTVAWMENHLVELQPVEEVDTENE